MKRKNEVGHRHWQQGFSLMELCIAIAIAGVISAIVIPLGLSMRQRYQLRASATDMLSTFKKAQSEAVKRNARVAVIITTGTPGICTVFVDDGAGGGGANNLIQDGTEVILFTTTTQIGNSLANDAVSPLPVVALHPAIEFNSGGIPSGTGILNITGGAGLGVAYRVNLSSAAGHVILQVSTDSGTTWD
jgi:type IV fimbrial biogenesis protein FimT